MRTFPTSEGGEVLILGYLHSFIFFLLIRLRSGATFWEIHKRLHPWRLKHNPSQTSVPSKLFVGES